MARRVRASVCQRIATSMTLPRFESVTSLINQRMSCLRCTKVVVVAYQIAGRSWARRRICSRCEAVSNRAACLGNMLCSRSSFSTSVSFSFQAASHQSVVRVDRFVATTGQVRFVLCPLNLTLPLVIDLPGTGLHLVQSREGYFQVGRLDGLQKAGDHGLINAIAAHGLAGS